MIALLASVIQLSLTSRHGTDEARMNALATSSTFLPEVFKPLAQK